MKQLFFALISALLVLGGCAPEDHTYDHYCGMYHDGIASVGERYTIIRREGAKVYHNEEYLVHDITCGDGHRWVERIQDLGRI